MYFHIMHAVEALLWGWVLQTPLNLSTRTMSTRMSSYQVNHHIVLHRLSLADIFLNRFCNGAHLTGFHYVALFDTHNSECRSQLYHPPSKSMVYGDYFCANRVYFVFVIKSERMTKLRPDRVFFLYAMDLRISRNSSFSIIMC